LPRCGKQIAYRLAKCGFGDELVHAVRTLSPDELPTFLDGWRDALRTELRTDASGILGRKYVSLAASVTNAVPDMDILKSYMCPVTSESEGRPVRPVEWNNEHSLSEIARCCEIYFEWGIKEMIVKRFRTVLWHASILRLLRRGAMDVDQLQSVASKRDGPVTPTKRKRAGDDLPPDTPSTNLAKHLATLGFQSPEKPMRAIREEEDDGLIVSITRSRTHASTDGLLEYRLEINPAGLVEMTESGIRGLRTKQNGPADFADNEDVADSDGENESVKKAKKPSKPPPKPDDHLLIWIPASIVKMAKGDHVTEFEESESRKRMKKEKKTAGVGKGKKKAVLKAVSETEEEDPFSPPPKSKASIAAMTKPKPASTTTAKTKRASHSPPLPKKPAAPVKKDTTARSSAHVTSQPKQLTAAASAARLLFASNSLPPADDSESDDPYADLLEQRASSRHIAKPRSPLLPIAKEGNRKSAKQPETEDRDDDWMLPTKSKTSSSFPTAKPKPNGKHPNRMLVDDSEDDSGEENTRPRPVSPSPQVSKVASTKFPKPSPTRTSSLKSAYSANDVIELSSDSDVAPPTQLFRPIAEAKAKAPSNSSIASRQQGSSQITKKKATATTGVIDLT
jgi:Holliday junction resolvase YEN1